MKKAVELNRRRTCLAGAAFASLLIAMSNGISGILLGRFLAGAFGASVPVAQAAVTDLVSENAGIALSRVAAASQLGVVVGPAFSAFLCALLGRTLQWPTKLCVRGVFAAAGLAALLVLGLSLALNPGPSAGSVQASKVVPKQGEQTWAMAQPLLRMVALTVGWSCLS